MKRILNYIISLMFTIWISFALTQPAIAQSPGKKQEPKKPVIPAYIEPDSRVQQRCYHFDDTNEELSYVVYVSSKVSKEKNNPLIVALHGYGGDGNFLVRERLVDLAEEQGYIVVGPVGYNVTSWYGIPKTLLRLLRLPPVDPPPNLAELSEKDVMNVLDIMKKEFNVDENRIYLMGHSMGGSGALFLGQKYNGKWAAIACLAPVTYMMMDQKQFLSNIKDAQIPVMIIQGDKDSAVKVEDTRKWVNIMKELKVEHEYIELSGGDHGTVKNDGMPDMFRFFDEHKKVSKK